MPGALSAGTGLGAGVSPLLTSRSFLRQRARMADFVRMQRGGNRRPKVRESPTKKGRGFRRAPWFLVTPDRESFLNRGAGGRSAAAGRARGRCSRGIRPRRLRLRAPIRSTRPMRGRRFPPAPNRAGRRASGASCRLPGQGSCRSAGSRDRSWRPGCGRGSP
jgi:hypothetical protein